MRGEDWPRVEEMFHAASQLGGAERDAYLARECAGDEALRREVESLVAALESQRGFMERPALSLGLRVLSGGPPGSLVGRSLGQYRVVRMLDGGGMGGEVYLADDCRLERPVALKFIAGHYAGDDWAKEQMLKEARAVARLEHPNICPVYGVEEIDGHHFIVMQYVEGETLASLMRREWIGMQRAATLAEQIAGALAFAHAHGVIHRDVKPQNIMVTAEGQAKVLDFGLAKFVRPKRAEAREGEDPEQTLRLGGVVGTPAYMSPEQACGAALDFRSDIFSFGVVLYEMLSGRNPFLRDNVNETIAAIRADDPPPLPDSPPGVPGLLGDIALQCVAKERERRPESADLLVRELRRCLRALQPGAAPDERLSLPRIRRRFRRYAAAALALLLLFSSLAGYVYLKLSRVHTLAVLPITNTSDDREADYLTEGLTRNLSDKFSYLPRLKLKLPSVAPQFAAAGAAAPEGLLRAGREMKADAVLAGTILEQDGALRLRAVLLDTEDGSQMWDRTFDLDPADLLALQEEITRDVASEMGLWLLGNALSRRQTDSEEALRLYMHGRHHWSSRKSPDDALKAIDFFERAVAADPSFAKAYAGLAECYTFRNNVAYGPTGAKEAVEKAGFNARRAVEAGDSLPESHTSMGLVKLRHEWDWDGAEREFRRAIELNPDYAPAHFWYANLLAVMGRFEDSIREAEVAKSLDPYSPLSAHNYARAFHYARRHDEAAARFRELVERYPTHPQFPHMLALVLMQQGHYDEAIATLERLRSTNPRYANAALGFAYGRVGRLADAAGILRDIERLSTPGQPMPAQERALVYIGMGERDKAFEALEEVYRDRFAGLAYLTTDPIYDGLRDDPRFADLARRANLTP